MGVIFSGILLCLGWVQFRGLAFCSCFLFWLVGFIVFGISEFVILGGLYRFWVLGLMFAV